MHFKTFRVTTFRPFVLLVICTSLYFFVSSAEFGMLISFQSFFYLPFAGNQPRDKSPGAEQNCRLLLRRAG